MVTGKQRLNLPSSPTAIYTGTFSVSLAQGTVTLKDPSGPLGFFLLLLTHCRLLELPAVRWSSHRLSFWCLDSIHLLMHSSIIRG